MQQWRFRGRSSAAGFDRTPRDYTERRRREGGAPGGTRTHDPWLRRPVLYPLSYRRLPGCDRSRSTVRARSGSAARHEVRKRVRMVAGFPRPLRPRSAASPVEARSRHAILACCARLGVAHLQAPAIKPALHAGQRRRPRRQEPYVERPTYFADQDPTPADHGRRAGVRRPGDPDHPARHVRDRAEGRRRRYGRDDAGSHRRAAASGRNGGLCWRTRGSAHAAGWRGGLQAGVQCVPCLRRGGRTEGRRCEPPGHRASSRATTRWSSTRSKVSRRCRRRAAMPTSTPIEVARAVVYMANQSGRQVQGARGACPGGDTKSAVRTRRADRPASRAATATRRDCNGAPKIGDRAAWTKRASLASTRRWPRPSRAMAACRRAAAWPI